jgi:hypothetical protein
MEPSNVLYECLCQTMASGSDEYFYRIFPLDFANLCSNDYIVIQEEMQQISQGTTGLSCWQVIKKYKKIYQVFVWYFPTK